MMTFNELSEIGNGRVLLNRYTYHGALEQQPILAFCQEQGIDLAFLELLWQAFRTRTLPDREQLRTFSIEMTLSYLVHTHQYYLHKMIPEIELAYTQLLQNRSIHQEVLLHSAARFHRYANQLKAHIQEEEAHFFRYARQLQKSEVSTSYSVNQFKKEHEHHEEVLEELVADLRQLAGGTSDMQRRVLCTKLEQLKHDIDVHAFVEDEVLVYKVQMLEIRQGK